MQGRPVLALANTGPIEVLLYLYIGKTEDDLKNFALRDLGILRTNKATNFSARFTDGEEAKACFHYSQLLDLFELKSESVFRKAVSDILSGPVAPSDYAAELRSRAACEAGQFFERQGEKDLSRMLYHAGTSPDCRERPARLLYTSGDKLGTEELLRQMIDDPASDEEFIFATDFYARKFKGKRTGLCTELLRAGATIIVDDTYRGNPEAGVAGVMRRQGYKVFFAENTLWQALFGLLFWDEIFELGHVHSDFDWIPHCLKDRSFERNFADQIAQKLEEVRAGNALTSLLKTITGHWGKPNGVFAWDHVNMEASRGLVEGAPADGIGSILKLMCDDFRATRDGFPDLRPLAAGRRATASPKLGRLKFAIIRSLTSGTPCSTRSGLFPPRLYS